MSYFTNDKKKHQSSFFNRIECDAWPSGNSANLPCMATLPANQMFADEVGHNWCPEHRQRGELLNWASQHQYPAIVCASTQMRYAVGDEGEPDNQMLWETAMAMGSEDMIGAVYAHTIGASQISDEVEL